MIIKHIEGATRVLGKSQGYLGLPVRDEVREFKIGGETVKAKAMVTAWEPTPDELERIKAGPAIYLCVRAPRIRRSCWTSARCRNEPAASGF